MDERAGLYCSGCDIGCVVAFEGLNEVASELYEAGVNPNPGFACIRWSGLGVDRDVGRDGEGMAIMNAT